MVKRTRHAHNECLIEADATSFKQRLEGDEELLILGVRGADEFNGELGHIKGALNIPLTELPSRMDELRGHHARPIIVVCLTDKRSTQAIRLMRDAELPELVLLRGGMNEWNAAAYVVEHALTVSWGALKPGLNRLTTNSTYITQHTVANY